MFRSEPTHSPLPLGFAITLALLGASSALGQSATVQADSVTRLQRVVSGLRPAVEIVGRVPVRWTLTERMAHYHVPGVSVAVIDSGRVTWARGFGVKQAGTTDSITPTTIFEAGSVSKPIAVTAMLRLVEQGKLSLDTNVNRYLRTWHVPENEFTAREKVTLRRIASHSAGLTVHGFPGYAVGAPVPTVPQILNGAKPANTAPVRVDTFPGARFFYSGGGITVMQLLLMDVTGKPFPELARELALAPSGMTHSTYEQPLAESRTGEASRAHDFNGVMIPGRWHVYPEMAAAGLWTTASDLARWALDITAARAGRSSTPLSPKTVAQMLTMQKEPLGLGVFLGGSGRSFHFGHGGDDVGFKAQLIMYPETGQGVAILANGDGGDALMQEIQRAVAAEYRWPETTLARVTPRSLAPEASAQLAGEYFITSGKDTVRVRIRTDGARLSIDIPSYFPSQELISVSSDTLVAADLGWRVRPIRGADARVRALDIELDPGNSITVTRSERTSTTVP